MVEVIHYETANKNKTIGYVDIRIPILKPTVLILRKISHIQSGDRRWFNMPSFSRDKPNGEQEYFRFFEFETQIYNAQLVESLTEPVKNFCTKMNIQAVEPMDFNGKMPTVTNDDLPF